MKLVIDRNEQNNSATQYRCPKCGHTDGLTGASDNTLNKSKKSKDVIIVFGENEPELRTMSTSKAECPKCKNNLAYIWQVQTRAGDEGSTQFFRCTKCSHTWRLYT
jgi:transcription factor S